MRDDLRQLRNEIRARPGQVYVYVLSRPDGGPFYVGVGTDRRVFLHETAKAVSAGNAKAAVIREILGGGRLPSYSIAGWFDNWELAAAEERRLIALYGRADLGAGVLANRTNGGQGVSGIKWHESPNRADAIRRAAEKNRGRKHTEEHKAKIGAAHKGRPRSAETLAKMSAALKGRPLSEEHRQKLSDAKKGRKPSAEMLAAGAKWRADNSEAMAAARSDIWNDPAYREKMSKVLKGVKRSAQYSEGNRLRQIEKFKDPEFKKRWAERQKEGFASPEVREKMRAAGLRVWAERRAAKSTT
jgi:hypothetical protein